MSYWSKLSMKDRANVMKLFLDKGISDLDTMRREYNIFAGGGSIHIDPSKKGTFTAAASKHGMGVQEFASKVLANKENYSPAMVKKANFARNASKWHGFGGNLFDGTTEDSQKMDNSYTYLKAFDNVYIDKEGNVIDPDVPSGRGTIRLPDLEVIANPLDVGRGKAARLYNDYVIESNDATATPYTTNSHLNERGIEGAAKAAAWMQDNPTLNNVGMALGAVPLAVATYPAFMAAGEGAATALANPYVDAALTSVGGAHAAQSLANGEADWMTALELAPLGRVVKPIYEGVVQPGMRLFNSPLTGNWTKIGNKEYRLSPSSLGANGSSLESRAPQITADNAANITPEQWKAAYRAAYERGDKAEGQRLWDLWFRQQAKNNKLVSENNFPVKLRHNTDSEPWNVYDESYFNSGTGDGGWYGKGLYASGNSWGENAYGKNTMNLYGYMEDPAVVPPANIGLDELPENFTTGYIAKDFFNQGISKEDYVKNLRGDALEWSKVYPELISKAINNTEKADGIIVQREASKLHPFAPFDEVILPKGTHIKSAEPFTLDDNGRLIDLTDRANFNINDLRYGLIPFGIGLTGYGLWQGNE